MSSSTSRGPSRSNRRTRLGAARALRLRDGSVSACACCRCEAGFYEKPPKDEIGKLEDEEKALGPKIDALLAEWEWLESELAALTGK